MNIHRACPRKDVQAELAWVQADHIPKTNRNLTHCKLARRTTETSLMNASGQVNSPKGHRPENYTVVLL